MLNYLVVLIGLIGLITPVLVITSAPADEVMASAQAQLIVRVALDASGGARRLSSTNPGVSLPDLERPDPLPSAAVYGRRDLLLPYEKVSARGHAWLPVERSSTGQLPESFKRTSYREANSLEVGVLSCRQLGSAATPGALSSLAAFCPTTETGGTDRHLLVIKAGWLEQGVPVKLYDPSLVQALLKRHFSQVGTVSLESWRKNAGLTVDTFVVPL